MIKALLMRPKQCRFIIEGIARIQEDDGQGIVNGIIVDPQLLGEGVHDFLGIALDHDLPRELYEITDADAYANALYQNKDNLSRKL